MLCITNGNHAQSAMQISAGLVKADSGPRAQPDAMHGTGVTCLAAADRARGGEDAVCWNETRQ